jgi:hypothetical protein
LSSYTRDSSLFLDKRRLNRLSDDEIEENINSYLPFRRGWPTLAPLPLKIAHSDAASTFSNYDSHLCQIRLLLEEFSLKTLIFYIGSHLAQIKPINLYL